MPVPYFKPNGVAKRVATKRVAVKNRVMEVVKGYENAIKRVAEYAHMWNASEGENRMKLLTGSSRRWEDMEGSGEFYEAVCTNEADSPANEVYEIQTGW